MTTHLRRLSACAAAAALLMVGGGSSANAATALPAHVYAPYFETWTTDGIAATAQQSGSKYFTLAFLETLNKRSCTLAWNGSSSQTVASGRYLSDIAALRAAGGDVILSLGGWSADQGGTEIAARAPAFRRSPPHTSRRSRPTTCRVWTWTSKAAR
jgi:hypothetical protein